MRKKIVIHVYAGMAGTDLTEFWLVPDNISQDALDELAWQRALDNAESYGIEPRMDGDEEDPDDSRFSDSIEGSWELYDPTRHDSIFGVVDWEVY